MFFDKRTNVVSALRQLEPNGNTSLRDSVAVGVDLIMKIHQAMESQKTNKKFVHIVLTDGEDNASKTSVQNISAMFMTIGLLIPSKMLTTHFIGIDLNKDSKAVKELQTISAIGLDNSHFHLEEKSNNVNTIFQKIQAEISVRQETEMMGIRSNQGTMLAVQQRLRPQLEITVQSYVVIFNLDFSGSMDGAKWRKVCDCVENFISKLGNDDKIAIILFNDKPEILRKEKIDRLNGDDDDEGEKALINLFKALLLTK